MKQRGLAAALASVVLASVVLAAASLSAQQQVLPVVGDAARGKPLFSDTFNCYACHNFDAQSGERRLVPLNYTQEGFITFVQNSPLPNMPAFHVSLNFDVQGPYHVAYPGAGQFYTALEEAFAALAAGAIDVALVGAVADQTNGLVEHHFARLTPPRSAADLGNAAAFLVVEDERGAAERVRQVGPVRQQPTRGHELRGVEHGGRCAPRRPGAPASPPVPRFGLGLGGLSAGRDDHVDLETDELGREIAEPLQAPVREPFLDHDRLADDVAEVAEPVAKRLVVGRRDADKPQIADAGDAGLSER